MKLVKTFFILLLFASSIKNVSAQNIGTFVFENLTEETSADTIPPSFPGGVSAFFNFLNKNIRYPQMALENEVEGRVVVRFTVMPDSTISSIIVLRDIGAGCQQEAVRVLKFMPKWIPATSKGKPIAMDYILSIKFKCEVVKEQYIEKINSQEIKN